MKKTIVHIITILVILFEVTVLSVLIFLRPKHAFGTIDTTAVIAKQAQMSAAHYPQRKLSQSELQHIAEQIKEKVEIFAKNKGLVIVAKGAIWGGNLPDYTEKILQTLNDNTEESDS